MKIKDLVGYTPGQLIAESYYESKMLKEEESDYYRDYQNGLISYEEYKDLVRQFQGRSGHQRSSSHHQPTMTGMYFYDVKPDQEEDAEWIGVKKTKSGKWALVQHDSSGSTFRYKKRLADQKFGPGKFWSPKNEGVSENVIEEPGPQHRIAIEITDPKTFDDIQKVVRVEANSKQDALDKVEEHYKNKGIYINNIKYIGIMNQELSENLNRKTDSHGRTQQEWLKVVKEKHPDAKIVQAKMIDGPVHAHLADGRKLSWIPAEQGLAESATAGATSSANIGTVDAPHISPGKARGKKSYTGSVATGSGTKAPPQPVVKQPKKKDGTAVNGLDIKGSSVFGGPANEATVIKRR